MSGIFRNARNLKNFFFFVRNLSVVRNFLIKKFNCFLSDRMTWLNTYLSLIINNFEIRFGIFILDRAMQKNLRTYLQANDKLN